MKKNKQFDVYYMFRGYLAFCVVIVICGDQFWADKFAVFRTDSSIKPFIRQEEEGVKLKAIAEGSELEFKHDKHWYGVDTWRNAGYGFWQHACLAHIVRSV